jgi:hypothetical protein
MGNNIDIEKIALDAPDLPPRCFKAEKAPTPFLFWRGRFVSRPLKNAHLLRFPHPSPFNVP